MRVTRESSTRDHDPARDAPDYDQLERDLRKAVLRVCPSWLLEERDDLLQVALLRVMHVHEKSEGFRALSSSYLRRVAYSALVDEIRRRRRRREFPLEEETWEVGPASLEAGPERRSMAMEIGRGIQECLERLVRPRRFAVVLHLQGHSILETARLMGWTRKRADNLVYRGLQDLRRCLESKGLKP